MNFEISQIAERIKGLRQILEISIEEMAEATDVSMEEYIQHEEGVEDYSFTFLYKCAEKFGVDITEIITGENPKLSFYEIVRKDEGMPIERRKGFKYQHLAYLFKHKIAEPFKVLAKYEGEIEDDDIKLNTHKGQEMDYILRGSLKVKFDNHIEVLHTGDTVYYDSGHSHGMVATGGEDCEFLAIVMKEKQAEK